MSFQGDLLKAGIDTYGNGVRIDGYLQARNLARSGDVYYVDDSGVDEASGVRGKTPDKPFATIDFAIGNRRRILRKIITPPENMVVQHQVERFNQKLSLLGLRSKKIQIQIVLEFVAVLVFVHLCFPRIDSPTGTLFSYRSPSNWATVEAT